MGHGLTVKITNMQGVNLATVGVRLAPREGFASQVKVPVNQPRTASINMSMDDPASLHVSPLERMLKIYYKPPPVELVERDAILVFWGPIITCPKDFDAGVIRIGAIDMSHRWRRHYLNASDDAVTSAYTMDGDGAWKLATAAELPAPIIAGGALHPGVFQGFDNTTPRPTSAALAKRGNELLATIQEMTKQQDGIDIDLVPVDLDQTGWENDGAGNRVPRGSRPAQLGDNPWYAQLDTWAYKGNDLSARVKFHYGMGLDNAAGYVEDPGGDQSRNRAVIVTGGGQGDAEDGGQTAIATSSEKWSKYGVLEYWEQRGGGELTTPDVLQETANAIVKAYGEPPRFVDVTLKPDSEMRFIPFFDFEHGDTVSYAAKRGLHHSSGAGRITDLSLEEDANGIVSPKVSIIPDLDVELDPS